MFGGDSLSMVSVVRERIFDFMYYFIVSGLEIGWCVGLVIVCGFVNCFDQCQGVSGVGGIY